MGLAVATETCRPTRHVHVKEVGTPRWPAGCPAKPFGVFGPRLSANRSNEGLHAANLDSRRFSGALGKCLQESGIGSSEFRLLHANQPR